MFRVFGPQMAEVPLVATRLEARRQGHARVLMDAFEKLLRLSGSGRRLPALRPGDHRDVD